MTESPPSPTLVLWDGACGFCRRCVAWMERRDRAGRFQALPYQEAPSPPMTPALAEACDRAVHVLLPDGRLLRAGRAVLHVLGRLGLPGTRLLALPPFIWGVELAYWVVARNRLAFSRWFFPCEDGGPTFGRRGPDACGDAKA